MDEIDSEDEKLQQAIGKMTEKEKADKFFQEWTKIALLTILYAFQGIPLGFFMGTVPILFKQYLSYAEIGVIMMCTMPFSFKLLWSLIVEFTHIKALGKRKSWVVPA